MRRPRRRRAVRGARRPAAGRAVHHRGHVRLPPALSCAYKVMRALSVVMPIYFLSLLYVYTPNGRTNTTSWWLKSVAERVLR